MPVPRTSSARSAPRGGAASREAGGDRTDAWHLRMRMPRSWGGDDRGALLILTGVLLVLGFVILGTTLVQLNANEDKVSRSQRDPLMESVDTLVASFAESLRTGVALGETDIDNFLNYTVAQQELLRDTAARSGLYADAKLNPNPSLVTYAGPDACGSPHLTMSRDGVIIGYEKTTLSETIVGAVYTLEFTDGRQKVQMDHYVKIHECSPGDLYSFPRGLSQHMGGATGLVGLKSADDERRNVTVVEELTGTKSYTQWGLITNLTDVYSSWKNVDENLLFDQDDPVNANSTHANRPSPPVSDDLNFQFQPTTKMNEVRSVTGSLVYNDFAVFVRAKDNLGADSIGTDDYLQLKMYPPLDPLDPTTLVPYWYHNFTLTSTAGDFLLYPPAPSGNPEWTFDEYRWSNWTLTVIPKDLKDSEHSFQVYRVAAVVTFTGPVGHKLNLEFDWPVLPDVYGNHGLSAVYRIPGTTTEEFQMQVYNNTTKQWDDIGDPWTASGTNWVEWHVSLPATLSEGHHYVYDDEDDLVLVRLVDKTDTDLVPSDRDTVWIDYLTMTSRFLGAV